MRSGVRRAVLAGGQASIAFPWPPSRLPGDRGSLGRRCRLVTVACRADAKRANQRTSFKYSSTMSSMCCSCF